MHARARLHAQTHAHSLTHSLTHSLAHTHTHTHRFVAHEGVREDSGVHVCDKRRSITNARMEFPFVDYTAITSDEDILFRDDKRESKAHVGERVYDFLMWLQRRPERTVAVASHSGWLMTVFNGVVNAEESLRQWFNTGEMRG